MTEKLKNYISINTSILKECFKDVSEEELQSIITDIVKKYDSENRKNPKFLFDVRFPDDTPTVCDVKINAIEKRLETDRPIITKYGTCFYRQDEQESILAKLLEFLFNYRKTIKKEMFTHINDEDQTKYNQLDTIQKTIKILMNSFYGVLTAKGSIFYSQECGASITYTGENIIMTAISIFERFLSNNIKFYSMTDMIFYCKNIQNEKYECEEEYDIKVRNISRTELYKYLADKYYNIQQEKILYKFDKNDLLAKYIKKLSQNDINHIYYKNNFKEFFNDCKVSDGEEYVLLTDYLSEIFEGTFLDPNKPSEEQKEILEFVLSIVKDYVFYNYQNFYKYWECHYGERSTVLTVDTDSNYLYLGPYFDYFKEKYPNIVDDSKEKVITVVNCITYFLTYVINETYLNLTASSNIPESHRSLINMKNEFLINRIMLTKNKKQYAYSAILREGELIKNPKLEIKGLPIKKVNVNPNVREYFSEILDNDIINSDFIDYSKITGKLFNLIDVIRDSINSGSTYYSIPEKVKEMSAYKEPFNQQAFRGCALWNMLFPNEEISFPTKVNSIKLLMPHNYDLVINQINEYLENNEIEYDKKELKTFKTNLAEVFQFDKLFKKDFINVISMPKNVKEIPLFLRPFLNTDEMVLNHVNSAATILDAIDINSPSVDKKNIPSNFIKF